MIATALLSVLTGLTGLAGLQDPVDRGLLLPPDVEVETLDGRPWYTVSARNASLEEVVSELARLSGREVEGLESLSRSALVTVELVRRPLDLVLEYTLGSVGLTYELRRDAIVVSRDEKEALDVDEGLELASSAWARAATRYPDHPDAPAARLAQGEIAELRGLLAPARDHYLTLVQRYPRSPLVAEAYMRAGRVSTQLGDWNAASQQFRALANLDVAPAYHAAARLAWAKTRIELGDPQSALHMLSALDASLPAVDATERTARLLVRARALNARELYMEALQAIDQADPDFDELGSREALEIRAVALEGIGLPGEAARAWLLYAESTGGVEQAGALQHSARLSLEAGDELACLFVVRRAEELGITQGLGTLALEARRRLGLTTAGPADPQGILARLREAEAWLDAEDAGQMERARQVFESLYLGRGALDEVTRSRVCVGWARCVAAGEGLEAALGMLSDVRAKLQSFEARRRLDLGAARLLEESGFDERAIDAYEGRY